MGGNDHLAWRRLGKGLLPTEDQESGLGHIVPLQLYWWVFVSLLLLTFITVWAATQDFGIGNLAIAMGIATVKAATVTLFFMHLNWESKITWGIVIYPLFIFGLILIGTLGDAAISIEESPKPIIVVPK